MAEIAKYWQIGIFVLLAIITVYTSIKRTDANSKKLEDHDLKINNIEKGVSNAISERDKKFIHIDGQLDALRQSNSIMINEYKEIKKDIKSIESIMKTMNDSLLVLSTTCNNRKVGC